MEIRGHFSKRYFLQRFLRAIRALARLFVRFVGPTECNAEIKSDWENIARTKRGDVAYGFERTVRTRCTVTSYLSPWAWNRYTFIPRGTATSSREPANKSRTAEVYRGRSGVREFRSRDVATFRGVSKINVTKRT